MNRPLRERRKPPISAFGPEIMAALLAGGTKEVRIPLKWRDAVQFRRRINQLRVRMREESHELVHTAERARATILFGPAAGLEPVETRTIQNGERLPKDLNAPAILLLRPYDTEFGAALKSAGVSVGESVGEDVLAEQRPTLPHDPLAAFDPTRAEDQ